MSDIFWYIRKVVGSFGKVTVVPPLDLANNKIVNLADGEDDQDAVTVKQLATAAAAAGALMADGTVKATAALDMDSHKIQGLTPGAATGEAVEFGQFDALQTQVDGLSGDQLADAKLTTIRIGTVRLNADGKARVRFKTATPATLTGSQTGPFDLTGVGNGGTIIVNPDGAGAQTVPINFAAGNHVGGTGCKTDMTAEPDTKFKIRANGDETWHTITCDWVGGSCDSGAEIAAEMQTKIRALGATNGYSAITVAFGSSKLTITSAQLGTGSKIEIARADDHDCCDDLDIGPDNGTSTDGTGDVADAAAATAAELAIVINADLAARSIVASDESDALKLDSESTGSGSSLVIGNGTLNTVLGFTNTQADYGSQGLGYAKDMDDANYVVSATLKATAQASLATKTLSVTNPATTGFVVECEGTSATEYVYLIVAGLEETA